MPLGSGRKTDFKPAPKPTLQGVLDHIGTNYRDTERPQKVTCPVHDDRRPSCNVDLRQQLINCPACEFGGDAWSLLMAVERLDFKGAVHRAAELGLPTVTGEAASPGGRRPAPAMGGYKPSWRR